MALTPEQLQAYWDANPQALEQAIADNPSAFGIQPSGMMAQQQVTQPVETNQVTQPTQSGLSDAALLDYWAQNPDALQQAIQQDPFSFLSKGLQQNYASWQDYENALTDIAPGAYDTAKFLRDLRLEQDLAYVPGTGSGGEARTDRQTAAMNEAFKIAEQLGMPLVNEQGMGLNTGFVYTRDGMIFKPQEGTVGEYNIVPERTGSSAANFMTDVGIPLLVAGATGDVASLAGLGASSNAALSSLLSQAATGNIDPQQILTSAATAGLLQGLGSEGFLSDVVPEEFSNIYSAQNVGGSFVQGTTNSIIAQAIANGEISLEDALKSGLITTGVDVATDLYKDALQTRDAQELLSGTSLQGSRVNMTPEEALRLENTSDLYGLLGEQGLLSKVGLDVGYLPTDWIGGAADLLQGFTGRTTAIIDGQEYRVLQDEYGDTFVVNPDGTLNTTITADDLDVALQSGNLFDASREGNILGEFLPGVDQNRYDERYFDVTTQRDSNAPLQGIFEKNPYARENNTWPVFSTEGGILDTPVSDNSLPSSSTAPITVGVGEDVVPTVPTAPIVPTETGMLSGTQGEVGPPEETPIPPTEYDGKTLTEILNDLDATLNGTQGDAQTQQANQPETQVDTQVDTQAPVSSNQALLDYWEQNPDKLEQAIKENPEAFGVEPEDVSTEQDVEEEVQAPTFEQKLEELWSEDPDKLAQAIQENPEAFGLAEEETELAEDIQEEEEPEQVEEEIEVEETLPEETIPEEILPEVLPEVTPEPEITPAPEVEETPEIPEVVEETVPETVPEVVPEVSTEPELPEEVPEITPEVEEIIEEDILENSLSDLLDDEFAEEVPEVEETPEEVIEETPEVEVPEEALPETEPEVVSPEDVIEELIKESEIPAEISDVPEEVIEEEVAEVTPEVTPEIPEIPEVAVDEPSVTPDVEQIPDVEPEVTPEVEPEVPTEPIEPIEPVEPEVTPEKEPEIPEVPVTPVTPEEPIIPEEPVTPEEPVIAEEEPEPEPEPPVEPEIPAEPEEPEIPEEPPVEPPVTPEEPEVPEEPPVLPPVEPPVVIPGPPGIDGIDGLPGIDGEDGLPGKDGEDGKDGMLGGLGKSDFKNFMASIEYVAPVLRELNIPLTDYISMWIKENK